MLSLSLSLHWINPRRLPVSPSPFSHPSRKQNRLNNWAEQEDCVNKVLPSYKSVCPWHVRSPRFLLQVGCVEIQEYRKGAGGPECSHSRKYTPPLLHHCPESGSKHGNVLSPGFSLNPSHHSGTDLFKQTLGHHHFCMAKHGRSDVKYEARHLKQFQGSTAMWCWAFLYHYLCV